MSDVLRLMRRVANAGVRLTLDGATLRVRGPEGSLTPDLRAAIAARRDELVTLLRDDGSAGPDTAISRRPHEDWAPLSPGQRRLWLLEKLHRASGTFNLTMAWQLHGPLDVGALQAAFDVVVSRHEILRATLAERDGEVVQVFAPFAPGRLALETVPVGDDAAATAEMQALAEAEAARPFDLTADPPIRMRLLRFLEHSHGLIVTMHHIASDHRSMVLLAGELAAAYTARVGGGGAPLADLPFQFGDYAYWQATRRREAAEAKDLEYWQRQLDDAPQLLELPVDHARPAVQARDGGRLAFDIDTGHAGPLLTLGAANGLTPFMTLLSVYAVLLGRYSGQSDLCIGCPVSSRREPGSDAVIGFFVDTVVLRVDLDGNPTIAELFARVRRTTTEALAHPNAPFDRVVDALGLERSASHTPLFQAMFVLQAAGLPPLQLPGLAAREVAITGADSEFDVTLFLEQSGASIRGHFEFRTDLFDRSTIAQLASHFAHLVAQWPADPSRRLSDIALGRPEDCAQILERWNPPAGGPASAFTEAVHARISRLATERPTSPAIVDDGATLSYAGLERRANLLAWRLIDAGAEPGHRIAVRVDSTREFVVAVLAILRAGCAYVPVPASIPEPRVAKILEGTGATLMVTARGPATIAVTCIDPSDQAAGAGSHHDDVVAHAVDGDDAAAIYHTSGSTGAPLGVVFTHRGLAAHARAIEDRYELGAADRVLQFAAWDFDVAAEEIFPTLCRGGVLVERGGADRSFLELQRRIVRHAITVLNLPASYWEAWVGSGFEGNPGALDSIRLLIVGSERVSGAAMARWHAATTGRIRTLNAYGTTEATITTTVHDAAPEPDGRPRDVVPVGRPLAHTRVYVLDTNGRLVPPLVPGEVWIGGAGVAAGYVNPPAVSADRFTRDPFTDAPSARMFRTGDRGRWLRDGTLELLGRSDRQITLRGFRIDPGDVESVLARHPRVGHAAVVLARHPGVPDRLVAYVSLAGASAGAGGGDAVPVDLHAFLAERLPAYMVPSAVVVLDALPVTSRGKTDVAALARRPLDAPAGATGTTAPASPEEAALAEIWAELLELPHVSTTDNFFALGGDSILGIAMISRARARGLRLDPHSLFSHQTIAELVRAAASVGPSADHAGTAGDLDDHAGPVPLAPIQERFFHEPCADRSSYHQAVRVELPAGVSEPHLRVALRAVVNHHAALRFRFHQDADGWSQSPVEAPSDPSLECHDLAALDEAGRDRIEAEIAGGLPAGLDLQAGRLVRAALVRRGSEGPAVLLLAIHHLVVDAVSFAIVLEDLERACRQASGGLPIALPPPTTPLGAWTRRLVSLAHDDALAGEVDWWTRTVEGTPAFPDVQAAGGDICEVTCGLEPAVTRDLVRVVPGVYNTRIQDVLLSALWIGAQAVTSARALRVDVEGHGRDARVDAVDLTRTVGWFTTIYPVRLEAEDPADPAGVLMRVKETLRGVPGGGLGYDVLRYLDPRPEVRARLDAGGQSSVLFNYLGAWRDGAAPDTQDAWRARPWLPGADVRPAAGHRSHAIEINGQVVDGRLGFAWTCPSALEPLVRAWSEAFARALGDLVDHCLSVPHGVYTPSDFPLAPLGSAQLRELQDTHAGFVPEAGGWQRDFEDVLPLTPLQLGMLSHSLRDPSGRSYLDLLTLTVDGGLDEATFQRAWDAVIARHPALRAAVVYEGVPEPLQIIRRRVSLPWRTEDVRGLPPDERAARIEAARAAELAQGFALGSAPLMRISLLRVDDRRHVLLWTTSHLILDGWSTTIVLREVFALYHAERTGRPAHLATPPPFASFIRRLVDRDPGASEVYWRAEIGGLQAPTPVPLGRRPAGGGEAEAPAARHRSRTIRLDAPLSDGLRALARLAEVTLSTLFQAAWALICSRDCGDGTVVFGLTVSGRPAELEGVELLVGALINTVPVVVEIREQEPVVQWLRRLHDGHLARQPFSDHALSSLHRLTSVEPGLDLFESLLIVQNYPVSRPEEAGGLAIAALEVEEATNYPLTLAIVPDEHIDIELSYLEDRLSHHAAGLLLTQLSRAFQGMVDSPDQPVRALSLSSPEERQRLLGDWGATGTIAVDPLLFSRQFEAQAVRTPAGTALIAGDREWTYAELEAEANRQAHGLMEVGVGAGVLVGICLESSPAYVLAVLAVLKTGGAFLPLDPRNPRARLEFMVADSGVALLVTTSALRDELPEFGLLTILVDDPDQPFGSGQSRTAPLEEPDADTPAYVIYTSGSTGEPKGVLGTHRGLGWLAANQRELPGLGPGDRLLQFAPIGFDASLWEIVAALGSGAALVLAAREDTHPGPPLEALLRERAITAVTLPPSSLAALEPGVFPALDVLIVAAESCPPALARTWCQGRRMFNAYGPTETSVCATIGRCDGGDEPPHIGRPLANLRVHILDERLEPVPEGATGELCVSGWGLAGGYLGREELTRERFVANPHAGTAYPAAGFERLYRTGDRARYRPDGTIEFLGRRDDQVKVRGFRVELGEVEAALAEHPGIRQCTVVLRDEGAGKYLAAYTVAREGAAPDAEGLRAFLGLRLSDHMIPTRFVSLPALPVSPNGKVARHLLPAPGTDSMGMDQRYEAPRTEAETALAAIWSAVLRLPRVGIHDNFFEIGGDSILAIQIVSRAVQAGVPITLGEFFQVDTPTIATLARTRPIAAAAAGTDAGQGPFPLTPIQRWFFEQDWPRHHYNQTLLFEVPADIDTRALDEALDAVRSRHDALRLRFTDTGAGWEQEYTPEGGGPLLEIVHLAAATPDERRRAIEAEARRQDVLFDPVAGRVFRAILLAFGDGLPERLLLSAHHLVVDGVSWHIILGDLAAAYARATTGDGPDPPPRTTSYRSWAERLAGYARAERLLAEVPYWRGVLSAGDASLPVDVDGDTQARRRLNTCASARRLTQTLDPALTRGILREVPAVYRTQINDVLLAAVARAFHAWTSRHDLLLHLEGHGRETPFADVNLTGTVGWFTTMFPVRIELDPGGAVRDDLLRVKETLRAVPHRGLGYGVLRYLSAGEDLGATGPEVSFNYLGQANELQAPAPWLSSAPERVEGDFSPLGQRVHVIDVNAIHLGESLQMDWIYSDGLHDEATIARLAAGFEAALRAILAHCRERGAGGCSPSDFPLARLDQADLDEVTTGLTALVDVLPVTSMQEQILRHVAEQPASAAYRTEFACELTGRLDTERFERCWRQVVARHAALRATFRALPDGRWVQRISDAPLPWRHADARGLAGGAIDHLLVPEGWDHGALDPAAGPLAGAALVRVADNRFRFVWRHHHLLLDGWSVSRVMQEALALYAGDALTETPVPLADYFRWAARRDEAAELEFWRDELRGVRAPRPAARAGGPPAVHMATLGRELSGALRAFAAAERVTVNTATLAAWAMTLASASDDADIVVGTTFSGRPPDLPGVDSIVGMLINTLPVRVQIVDVPMGRWLAALQQRLARGIDHSAVRLSAIEEACDLPAGGFDTTFRFQNYPIDPAMATDPALSFRVSHVDIRDAWHYPLNLSVTPGDDIHLIADYFPAAYSAAAVDTLTGRLIDIVGRMVRREASSPRDLMNQRLGAAR